MHARPAIHHTDPSTFQILALHNVSHVWDVTFKKSTEEQCATGSQSVGISRHVFRKHIFLDVRTNHVPGAGLIESQALPSPNSKVSTSSSRLGFNVTLSLAFCTALSSMSMPKALDSAKMCRNQSEDARTTAHVQHARAFQRHVQEAF